jgi:hypothetical protein
MSHLRVFLFGASSSVYIARDVCPSVPSRCFPRSLPGLGWSCSSTHSSQASPPSLLWPPTLRILNRTQQLSAFIDFPPIEEYPNQTMYTDMDVDADESFFASDAPTPDFSPSFDTDTDTDASPSPPPPFTPISNDWEAHVHDPALANSYERGEFIHENLQEHNRTFDRVEYRVACPRCRSSSMLYPSLSNPQLQGDDQSPRYDLSVMLTLLKHFLEETATRPARVEDLDSLELACIMELSEKFRGGLPPSAAVMAVADVCGL